MRTTVYIDGQNFLYKVADILIEKGLLKNKQEVTAIDIPWLLSQVIDNTKCKIRFYGVKKIHRRKDLGEDIYKKSVVFSDNARKIRNCIQQTGVDFVDVGKLKIREGDICKKCGNQDYHFQEKGVDVGLAVDLVKDALTDSVDEIVLLSSDTDLIPAILVAKEAGKKIIYVGFEDKLTKALASESDAVQILRKKEVVSAWEKMKK